MIQSGPVRKLAARLGLSQEQAERWTIELLELARSADLCAHCAGRESCLSRVPGMRLIAAFECGRLYLSYEPCEKDRDAKRRLAQERLLSSSRMPAGLREKTFTNFVRTNWNELAYMLATKIAEGKTSQGLLLAGPPGTGKTHLAAAIINARIEAGQNALFCTTPELLGDIRRVLRNEDETSELMELIKDAPLLVLDDLGAEKPSEWVTEQLFVLLNARLLRGKQTVITTNFDSAEKLITRLGGIAGQRIVSRLVEMCQWVKLDGPDWRILKQQEGKRGTGALDNTAK